MIFLPRISLVLAILLPLPLAAADAGSFAHSLDSFGPTAKPQEAQETYAKALVELQKTGGVLAIPAEIWRQLKPLPLQSLSRTPAPPAETRQWREGNGVTILAADNESVILQVPPMSGLRIERPLRLADGDSLPHWGTHPAVTLESQIVYGSSSFLDWIQAPVEKGENRRFYVPTIRGLRPGQFLNLHGGPGYGGGVTRGCIKSLGFDQEKKLPYFVADTSLDHVAGAIVHNKSNTGLVHMLQTSHNDNQTYDMKIIRNQYAHGDTYMYYCDFNYMSNVHSAAGDENGNCYAAFIRTKGDNFHATVKNVEWPAGKLSFTAARNLQSLGDSRPLVNLNPQKALVAGKVRIVPSNREHLMPDGSECQFEGRSYPTVIVKNPTTGATELDMGGLIRGDQDCPWTAAVVGRWFAVADKSEKTPQGNYRWYEISAFRENTDGTKEIEVRRYWWGAKSAGGVLLYRADNYTWDGHERPLEYIIAPGTYVNDVSWAVPGGDRGGQSVLGIAPFTDQGTELDFAAGDPVEQAIGPDPFKPNAFRCWMWEDVPSAYPASILDLANHGAASRFSAMSLAGGPANLDDVPVRHEPKPAWDNIIVQNTAVGVGFNLKADFADAAILLHQPNREQPIKWRYGHQEGQPPKTATLTVSRDTGTLNFQGGGVKTNGSVSAVRGLSGDDEPAQNLRGKNLPVAASAVTFSVKFATPEADGDYAVFVEQTWLTNRAISDKTAAGFTVTFDKPAPAGAKLDWMLVR
ncbi:MAG: hypothetical protein SFU86_12000 [Pirellulaceae bacterium]|nr:hypothetical protein [Pirellulaceae bacterium]